MEEIITEEVLARALCEEDALRCITHVDMDCFYAQVEAVRLGIDCRTQPLLLSQWDMVIAANYPARACGVEKNSSLRAALAKCPSAVVALSPSYRVGETVCRYHPNPTRDTHKLSLEPYRAASRAIFDVLRAEPGVVVERAGIDEAYLDVTAAARAELRSLAGAAALVGSRVGRVLAEGTRVVGERGAELAAWARAQGTTAERLYDAPLRELLGGAHGGVRGSRGFCVGGGPAAVLAGRCLLLCAASRVVLRVRARVRAALGYDCSAGIAHNRVLAKCMSALHKPNQQTVLPPDRGASALYDVCLGRLRGLGGKFGRAVAAACGGAQLCREAWLVAPARFAQLEAAPSDEDEDGEEEGGGDSEGEGDTDGVEEGDRKEVTKRVRSDSTVGAFFLRGGRGHLTREAATVAGESAPALDASEGSHGEDGGEAVGCTPSGAEQAGAGIQTFFYIRGVGGDRVADPAVPRSLSSMKVFHSFTETLPTLAAWMRTLCADTRWRYLEHEHRYEGGAGGAGPVTVAVHVHTARTRRKAVGSLRFPADGSPLLPTAEVLAAVAVPLLKDALPPGPPHDPHWEETAVNPPVRYLTVVLSGLQLQGRARRQQQQQHQQPSGRQTSLLAFLGGGGGGSAAKGTVKGERVDDAHVKYPRKTTPSVPSHGGDDAKGSEGGRDLTTVVSDSLTPPTAAVARGEASCASAMHPQQQRQQGTTAGDTNSFANSPLKEDSDLPSDDSGVCFVSASSAPPHTLIASAGTCAPAPSPPAEVSPDKRQKKEHTKTRKSERHSGGGRAVNSGRTLTDFFSNPAKLPLSSAPAVAGAAVADSKPRGKCTEGDGSDSDVIVVEDGDGAASRGVFADDGVSRSSSVESVL